MVMKPNPKYNVRTWKRWDCFSSGEPLVNWNPVLSGKSKTAKSEQASTLSTGEGTRKLALPAVGSTVA